ncbi:MAG TPA: polysaccharide biosynthesis/export family protein [Candidatus Omnitrophota bacterium]|nr:polysaccharide biosynthesis/export family protein [Candidatus Omnitrophota bacterium]HPT08067.1 polysaccharide biosynthesis/export family protein [Candidatus Omnitrophota bacterium]
MNRKFNSLYIGIVLALLICAIAVFNAQAEDKAVEVIDLSTVPAQNTAQTAASITNTTIVAPQPPALVKAIPNSNNAFFDPLRYTLGSDDVIDVTVMRHPEFSGNYTVSMDGKIQYKFVGDIDVNGLTKKQLEDKITKVISMYVITPAVDVTVKEYRSKVIFILGEVQAPGKYYMRSENIPLREAVVQAGLPTLSASMRKCHLITPDKSGHPKIRYVDLYAILYGGDLTKNIDMKPGEVLYVPSTVMAKIVRIINPISQSVGVASSGPTDVGSAKSAITNMAK